MERNTNSEHYYYDDEIDLFELAEVIWAKKWLIVVSTFIFALLAGIYAYTASPVYQAEITIKPPTQQDIIEYNKSNYIDSKLPKFSRNEVFQLLLEYLNLDSLRREFFKERYLPHLNEKQLLNGEETLYRQFEEAVSLKVVNAKENPYDFVLSVNFGSAEVAAQLRDELLKKAIKATKADLKGTISSEILALADALKLEIDRLRSQAEAQRVDGIEQLSEALYVAKAVKLEQPAAFVSGKYSLANTPFNDGNPLYLQGSIALEAQIKALKERKNNDAHIPGIRKLETQWQKLSTLTIDENAAKVASYVDAAFVPERPVKPRKLVILAIGILFGGLTGVVYVLLVHAISERKITK